MLMQLLAIAGGATTAISLVAIIALAFKLSSAKDGQRAAVELAASRGHDCDAMRADRDHFVMLSDTRGVENAQLKALLALADKDTAKAVDDTVKAVVEHIETSGIADAVRLGNSILSRPWGRQP